MPSPVAHALAGLTAGWMVCPLLVDDAAPTPPEEAGTLPAKLMRQVRRWRWPLAFAAVSLLPDLDLLAHRHSQQTHSLGAAAIVFVVSLIVLRGRAPRALRLATALSLSYASHVLLDWLGADTTPPIGIMALWPFSGGYHIAPVHVFMGISRKVWLAIAWRQDLQAVGRELIVLVPVAGAALWARKPEVLKEAARGRQQLQSGGAAGLQSRHSRKRREADGESA